MSSGFYSDIETFKQSSGYEIDGGWYPRVTKIVEIKAKPGLANFYRSVGSYDAARGITENAAKEGTLVHEVAEKILIGEHPAIPVEIQPAMTALSSFLEHNDIRVDKEFVERRIFHPEHRYAGTIDTLALIDGKFGVLDIKTSQAIYRDYNLQTSAYIEALLEEFPTLETRWILRIDQTRDCQRCGSVSRTKGGRETVKKSKTGAAPCINADHDWTEVKGRIEMQESPYWQHDFQAFLGAKKLWEWENEYWLRKIGYLE